MANDKTREEVVTENFEAAVAQYGEDNFVRKILPVVLEDISVSLARLVDKQ